MRQSKKIYYGFLDHGEYFNIGDLLIECEGIFVKVEDIPDSYLQEYYGYTKEELYEIIEAQLHLGYDEF
jgi:hypothetical protein